MPSWLPGDDYMTNFKVGDPFVQIDDGYARLPGAGYEALHPELKGTNPEDYPDIHKLRILSDVAPYSREYTRYHRPACNKNPRARAPGPSSIQDQAQHSGPVLRPSPGPPAGSLVLSKAGKLRCALCPAAHENSLAQGAAEPEPVF